jgi:Ca-activated chloride channel family protein
MIAKLRILTTRVCFSPHWLRERAVPAPIAGRPDVSIGLLFTLTLAVAVLFQGCMQVSNSARTTGLLPASAGLDQRSLSGQPLPYGSDEVWILARSERNAAPFEEAPGSGTLVANVEEKKIPMPLKHTDVKASVSGPIATVEVIQQFLNPYSRKIEATYIFPLPHNAAVNEFILTIGDRRIRGIIRERKEAEQLYQDARQQGYVASLLTEERPNIFSQRVANLEPGKEIAVNMKYLQPLDYLDGWYEFVFPMVVGPRFNPPGTTSGIGAVARRESGTSGQPTEIEYLRPGERTSHNISLKLDVDAGVSIEETQCKTHQVVTETHSPEHLTVLLAPTDTIPNKDFVFRYRVASETIKSGLLTHRDARGGFFNLIVYPPRELGALKRQPLELFFLLDCSGSMAGRPIEQAKAAVETGLHLLEPGDSFQLIIFSSTATSFGDAPLDATAENVQQALRFLRSLKAEGGTMMLEGIKTALDSPSDPRRPRLVCILTDGYIGNEKEILGEIHRRLGPSRIFSMGIGTAPNRYLLDHMASLGHGAVAYLGPNDSPAQIMEDFFARISHPAMTGMQVDWGGLHVSETFPSALPDLFVGRPIVVTGRFAGDRDTSIRVNGMTAGQPVQVAISAKVADTGITHSSLPSLWRGGK